jgi:hypothetical protein
MLAMGQNPHARGDLYFNLDQTCQIRGVVGSIEEQLLEDRTGRPLAGPRARMPLRFLTPETWQVVVSLFPLKNNSLSPLIFLNAAFGTWRFGSLKH